MRILKLSLFFTLFCVIGCQSGHTPQPGSGGTPGGETPGIKTGGKKKVDPSKPPRTDGNGIAAAFAGTGSAKTVRSVIQPDGKILAVGKSMYGRPEDVVVTRFTDAGLLDPSFGKTGRIAIRVGTFIDPQAITVQSDGRIVIGLVSDRKFVLVRLNPEGSLDASFGQAGFATVSLDEEFDYYLDVTIHQRSDRPDLWVTLSKSWYFRVLRFLPNGELDSEFRLNQGVGETGFAFEMDGKNDPRFELLPGGAFLLSGRFTTTPTEGLSSQITRFTRKGEIDPSFGQKIGSGFGALIELPDPGAETSNNRGARSVVTRTLEDGRILIVKIRQGHIQVDRLQATGDKDPSFTLTDLGTEDYAVKARGIFVKSDGKIIIALNGLTFQVLADGGRDPSFGKNGRLLGETTALDDEDRLVMESYNWKLDSWPKELWGHSLHEALILFRARADGSLDPSFGPSWKDFPSQKDYTRNLKYAPDYVAPPDLAPRVSNASGSLDLSLGDTGALKLSKTGVHQGMQRLSNAVLVPWEGFILGFSEDAGREQGFTQIRKMGFDGKRIAKFQSPSFTLGPPMWDEVGITHLVRDSTGAILSGSFTYTDGVGQSIAVNRVYGDGVLDQGFGKKGTVLLSFPHDAYIYHHMLSLAVDTSRRAWVMFRVCAPHSGFSDDFNNCDYYLARLRPDGALDPSFAAKGLMKLAGLALVQPLSGGGALLLEDASAGIKRVSESGQLDPSYAQSFGQGSCRWNTPVLQPDGKPLASFRCNSEVMRIIRLDPRGEIDSSFNSNVVLPHTTSAACRQTVPRSMSRIAPDASGGILVGRIELDARDEGCGDVRARYSLSRLKSDGSLDSSFGRQGTNSTVLVPRYYTRNGFQTWGIRALGVNGDLRIYTLLNVAGSLSSEYGHLLLRHLP